ncbi:hypothetical protein AX14_013120 [Amanita brunnescens Koide BX004]|nr:hypothetical protein AX14_013120 [Amanita brunnescens Koide BX004]
MAKQVSRYQHLAVIANERDTRIQELEREAADKDAYVLKTEREHAEIYREREAAKRLATSLKQELQNATSLFETTREARWHDQEDFDERTMSFKKHIAELNAKLNLLPAGEAELRSLVSDANERAGIAEEEYRKKSAELKLAHKEIAALKTKQAKLAKPMVTADAGPVQTPMTTGAKPSPKQEKTVRWGFEPSDNAPASQPFWDHSNEYSKYIASMVAATVTAIPSIPMQMAISSAINTVRAAGPSIFSQSPESNTSASRPSKTATKPSSPSPHGPPPQQRTRSPAPATGKGKGSKSAPIVVDTPSSSNITFAQMAASVLNPPAAAPVHQAKVRPTWRAVETNKDLVINAQAPKAHGFLSYTSACQKSRLLCTCFLCLALS